MLHFLILRYICHSMIFSVLKRFLLFVPEWFESAGLMMHMGFCGDFLNQNK